MTDTKRKDVLEECRGRDKDQQLSMLAMEIRELRNAIRRVAERRRRPGHSANDHFERLAAMFMAETGRMAPGKSEPMEMGPRDREADMTAWETWCAEPYDALVALLPDTGGDG